MVQEKNGTVTDFTLERLLETFINRKLRKNERFSLVIRIINDILSKMHRGQDKKYSMHGFAFVWKKKSVIKNVHLK